jgi:hypothetical protein
MNKIPEFILKRRRSVQNIKSVILELRDVFKNRGATAMIASRILVAIDGVWIGE